MDKEKILKNSIFVLGAIIMALMILWAILNVPTTLALESDNRIELYSDIPDWAQKEGRTMGLNIMSGVYRISSGASLKAGSKIFVREDWLTFPSGLLIHVGKGGINLKGKSYPAGTVLKVGKNGKLTQV